MNEYNSILKEKKTYQDAPTTTSSQDKSPNRLFIDVILITIILIISYIVYYQTVLSPEEITIYDFKTIIEKYQSCFKYLYLDKILTPSSVSLDGTLKIPNYEYNYQLIKEKNNLQLSLETTNNYLLLLTHNNQTYLTLTKENQIFYEKNDYYLNILENLKNNFQISNYQKNFKKSLYYQDSTPIVEVNLELTNTDLNNLFGYNLFPNEATLLITLKNNAFTDQIIQVKVSYNDKKENTRQILYYQDNDLYYQNNQNQTTKFSLTSSTTNFTLKIYQEDVLYSVLTGIKQENSYKYTYQIIDKIYNLTLEVIPDTNNYTYNLTSNISDNDFKLNETATLTLTFQDSNLNDIPKESSNYTKLTSDEQQLIQNQIDTIINPLRQFINQYQNHVN